MNSSSSSLVKASSTPAAAVVVTLALGISLWIQYTKRRWKNQLESFIEQHENDGRIIKGTSKEQQEQGGKDSDDGEGKDILLIVNPASGGGKSIRLYPRILKELRRVSGGGGNNTGNNRVHVIITKSSEEMKELTQTKLNKDGDKTTTDSRRYHPISRYQVIAIMGGDSSITEFVQHELVVHQGKWPYAPILHLPTGTGNAISSECFGPCDDRKKTPLTIEELIRCGVTKSKLASVIEITSNNNNNNNNNTATTAYAVHNCFDGVQRHMLDTLDNVRGDLYPAFGGGIVIPLILMSLFTFRGKEAAIPYILAINTDTEGMGMQLNFGLSRFSDDSKSKPQQQMMILQARSWPGPMAFLQLFLNFMSGQLGKDFTAGTKLPHWLHVERTNEFTLPQPTTFASHHEKKNLQQQKFHMYLDGGGTIPCEGNLPVTFKVIPNAIPYFVHDDFDDIFNNNNNNNNRINSDKKNKND